MFTIGRVRGSAGLRRSDGFTLIELLIVVAVIGILTAIGIAVYTSMQQSARIAKAQADVRAIATAASHYLAHTGAIAPALDTLTVTVTNPMGQTGGPFLGAIPTPPLSGSPPWSAYTYIPDVAGGAFSVTAGGDGTTVVVP